MPSDRNHPLALEPPRGRSAGRSALLGLGLLALLAIVRLGDVGPVPVLRHWGFDLLLGLPALPETRSPVLVVDIDDESLRVIGQWPWPRDIHARIVDRLASAGASVVVLDLLFAEPDRMSPAYLARVLAGLDPELRGQLAGLGDHDAALAAAMRRVPVVSGFALSAGVGPASTPLAADENGGRGPLISRVAVHGKAATTPIPSADSVIRSLPEFERASQGWGVVNLYPDRDAVTRTVPGVVSGADAFLPGVAIEAVRVAAGAANLLLEVPSGVGPSGIVVGGQYVPTDRHGRIWIDSREPQRIPIVPAERLLAGGIADAEIAGRAVIVGNSASGTSKLLRTVSGDGVSGSLFQALAIDSIVNGRVFVRPPVADHLEIFAGLMLGLILVAVSPRLRLRSSSLGLVSGGVALGLPLTAVLAMATGGVLVDVSFPLLVGLSLSALVTLECLGEERAIRRHQKALLKRRDAYMRQVVDTSFDAIVTVDAAARILTANAGAADLFGVPKERLPGTPIGDMLAGSWAATLRETPELQLGQAVHKRGVINATVVGSEEHAVEAEMTVAETATETHRVFVIVLRDISMRRRAERAAARAGERLRAGVEAITDGFVLFGGDRRLIICNARYRDMLGQAGAMAIPGADFDAVMEAYAATAGAPADAAGRAGEWVVERAGAFLRAEAPREQHCLDGRWFRVDERPTAEGGMVGVYTDISVLKNRESELDEAWRRAEAASSAKSEFLANMSHELRTPLNAVIGFADLMKREIFGPMGSPHYRDYAGHIIDSGSKLLSMIEEILDFSRSEHAGGGAGDVSTRIDQVVMEVLRDIAPAALDRKISVVPELGDRVPPLNVDAAILYQILQNLVSNAVKFSPDETEIRVVAFVDEDGGAGLSVDDRGRGIPPDLVDKVTQPFWQREGPLVRSHDGVGLGLAIVKSHVDALGGSLRFEGRVGGGTRVTVRFPPSRTAIDG